MEVKSVICRQCGEPYDAVPQVNELMEVLTPEVAGKCQACAYAYIWEQRWKVEHAQ